MKILIIIVLVAIGGIVEWKILERIFKKELEELKPKYVIDNSEFGIQLSVTKYIIDNTKIFGDDDLKGEKIFIPATNGKGAVILHINKEGQYNVIDKIFVWR